MGFAVGSSKILLVILSFIVMVISSYSAFNLYSRYRLSPKSVGRRWFISGSFILGIGIWCLQYIGIFVYVPIGGLYLDLVYVLFTLLLAIILSYFSACLLKLKNGAIFSSIAFGITICTTNFIGWEAYHGDVDIELHFPIFLGVVSVGCTGIFSSLRWVKFLQNNEKAPLYVKLAGAVSFGLALALFRYLLRLSLIIEVVNQQITPLSINMPGLVIGIAAATIVLIVSLMFGSSLLEKVMAGYIKTKTIEQYYQSLYEQNPDLIVTFDLAGKFLSVNRVVERYGYTEDEIINQSFVPFITPDQIDTTNRNFHMAKKGQRVNYDSAFYGENRERFEVNISNFPIIVNNQTVGVYAVIKDITEFKKAQVTLAEAEDKYRSLTENSVVGSYIVQGGKFIYANQKLLELLGYSEGELIGSNVMNYVFPEDYPVIFKNEKGPIHDLSSTAHYQYRMVKKDHSIIYIENFVSAMIYQGQPAVIGTIVDITARKKAEETIEYIAYHDSLTGLLNRNTFCSRLKGCLSEESTECLALLYIDLDEFKMIDDALGHEIGDQLFKDVSNRLLNCVPNEGDMGRNRGDEFLVSLLNKGKMEASMVAEHMIASLAEPFLIDRYELYITPSIGISLYPNDTEDQADLIKKAETAMNQVKKGGKNGYQFYNPSELEISHEQLELEMRLRKALEHEEFMLHYQPKFDLSSGKMKGVEALIRWNHPTKGFILPGDFIPIAEEMGLIIPIGEWVLRTACKQMMDWQKSGLPPFQVSVNLSVRQLYQPNLVEMVREVVKGSGIDPKNLELEITESMMADSDHAIKIFNDLKSLGLKISLDDFGTGYSSLHYLKEAPIDKLKIDQSFIRNCAVNSNEATLVRTIIAMAHQLDIEVIAEGVETVEHLIFLQQNLCDEAQGFLFSKPIPLKELEERFGEMEKIVQEYGITKDLMDRKWMENALETARQEVLETIRKQQGMTFKFIKKDGRFIHTLCDGELTYRMGLVPEQIIGRELKDFQPIKAAERKEQYYRRAWQGEMNVSYEGEINGIFYLASLRPVKRGGEVIGVIGSCIDITERKKIEEALRISESNFRLITDNMLDMIEVWDINGLVKYASPSHEKGLGHPHHLFVGRSAFSLVHAEDRAHVQSRFDNTIANHELFQAEFRCKNANGDWVYIEAQGTPVFGTDNRIKHVVVVGRDVTERKRMDEFIRKSEKWYGITVNNALPIPSKNRSRS
ncbi:EAL domain-containing protein [Neobacillus muris]|uniref:EAL domain-containing protein n=1 Tax=Neobacillus muris TaxID=2941334 RepID=UPI00203B0F30|nr:EAL domain-containing protein [Neobacillus muris]